MLGDEREARQSKKLTDYQPAVRAHRQLAVVLRDQGLNEAADRFTYRAQVLQRQVFWLQMSGQHVKFSQRVQRVGRWLFSWFLAGVAGYGYKPQRWLFVYGLALVVFTFAHFMVGVVTGPHLSFLNALAVSVQSLHGRLFSFQSGDRQTILNTIEAFVGLFIEAIVFAVITQRILGK